MKQTYLQTGYGFPAMLLLAFLLASCSHKNDYDASGNFEADEVIVSAQQNGELLSFPIQEGDRLKAGEAVGQIDVTLSRLGKEQVEASITALRQKTSNAAPQTELVRRQLAVQQARLEQQQRERSRTANLVKADAATQKQLDDIDAAIEQLQKEMNATRQQIRLGESNTATQNRGILSERSPLEVTARQYQEQIDRGQIINPISGVVLTKYALRGEVTAIGKPLYKIADTDTLSLKAYVTGDALTQIKTGQPVTVRIDQGKKAYKNYSGIITWISSKSEFTPKTIQTKSERANLVYAIKVRVKNDGYLKIGMYGEVLWHHPE
ncbi:HlyD family secretion protein [Compostibacter hankyongensis]|uniref:HlyD family efflux transporter periplasmic adaptor subunit n=1 Tax=Compostibacter hankyongensis TaxID=1007089 RepID=A0ABP8G1U7_9BACT